MTWIKGSQLFHWQAFPNFENYTHAGAPYALAQGDGNFLIYFAVRDENGYSLPYCIKARIDNESLEIVGEPIGPLMQFGERGTFDDTGVLPTCVVRHNDEYWMYYIGWTLQTTVPYQLSIGLAISKDGINFERYSNAPLMTKSLGEPYFVTAPHVVKEGNEWVMYYVSCTGWHLIEGRKEPQYSIKKATSEDGINWIKENKILLDYDGVSEAYGRPTVISLPNKELALFFCYRKLFGYRNDARTGYRITHAIWDGNKQSWEKKYEDTLPLGEAGEWDEIMACYGHVFNYQDKFWLIYNGNDFGKTGFGYAQWIPEQ